MYFPFIHEPFIHENKIQMRIFFICTWIILDMSGRIYHFQSCYGIMSVAKGLLVSVHKYFEILTE